MTDTGPAKLPGLPKVSTDNPALNRWIQAIAEHVEVRAGARGNPAEAVVLQRDLKALKAASDYLSAPKLNVKPGDMVIDLGGGLSASVAVDAFAELIRNSRLFKDLIMRLDDPRRFDALPEQVRKILLNDIAEVAAKLGASISRVETKSQTAISSLAMVVEQVTASIEGTAAGVRELTFASAEIGRAQAGKVTQMKARLDGKSIPAASIYATSYTDWSDLVTRMTNPDSTLFYKVGVPPASIALLGYSDKLVGSPLVKRGWYDAGYLNADGTGTLIGVQATLEQQMIVTADRVDGAEGKYTLKIGDGKALVGFGMLAYDNMVSGGGHEVESAFIIQADKFALVGTNNPVGLVNEPPLNSVPFGVDSVTGEIFMNAHVYVKGAMEIELPGGKRPLSNGLRGSVSCWGDPSYFNNWLEGDAKAQWNDNCANWVIWLNLYSNGNWPQGYTNHLVIGDRVTQKRTQSDGSIWAQTRQWIGNAWTIAAFTITGDMVVDGTLAASKINTEGLTIKHNGVVIFGAGTGLDWSQILHAPTSEWLNSNVTLDNLGAGSLAHQNEIYISPPWGGGNVRIFDGTDWIEFKSDDFVNRLSKINNTNISAFMENAAIGNAYIGNAAVETLNIAGNAVTVPLTYYEPGAQAIGTAFTMIGYILTDRIGSIAHGSFSYTHQNTGGSFFDDAHTVDLQVRRAGGDNAIVFATSFSAHGAWTFNASFGWQDQYTGPTWYYVEAKISAGSANAIHRSQLFLDAKR